MRPCPDLRLLKAFFQRLFHGINIRFFTGPQFHAQSALMYQHALSIQCSCSKPPHLFQEGGVRRIGNNVLNDHILCNAVITDIRHIGVRIQADVCGVDQDFAFRQYHSRCPEKRLCPAVRLFRDQFRQFLSLGSGTAHNGDLPSPGPCALHPTGTGRAAGTKNNNSLPFQRDAVGFHSRHEAFSVCILTVKTILFYQDHIDRSDQLRAL